MHFGRRFGKAHTAMQPSLDGAGTGRRATGAKREAVCRRGRRATVCHHHLSALLPLPPRPSHLLPYLLPTTSGQLP